MKKKKNRVQFISAAKLWFSIFGGVIFITLVMSAMFKVDFLMKDRRILEREYEKISSQTERLQAEVDRLSNIDRITRIARSELGMVNNRDESFAVKLLDKERLNECKEAFAERGKKNPEINFAGVR
jgi:cell division protein FtsL